MRLFTDVSADIADPHLRAAYLLAERARGATAPNPLVGCVIVSARGEVVGRGFHPRAGQPHAEVFALRDAGDAARGATVYVTLEPCNHHGRTPPCTDALITAGVARVVIGMRDPNPESAEGVQRLQAAGVDVEIAEDPSPFESQNEGWLKRIRSGTPFVRVKVGISLDARPAFTAGQRSSMTGGAGRKVTARLRAASDAVLVGAGTVDADDPALTVRDADGTLAEHQPLRVVLIADEVPAHSASIFTDDLAPTLTLAPEQIAREAAAELGDALVEAYDPPTLVGAFEELGRRGVSEVLVEAGPRLLSALWSERLIDELVVVTAGGMAGDSAPDLYRGSADRYGDALHHVMRCVEAGMVGDVAVTVWRPAPGETE